MQYSKAAGGGKDFPQLEGVKIDGHWAIIYSKYDIGCALERHQGLDCKGYNHESALRIAANIVIYCHAATGEASDRRPPLPTLMSCGSPGQRNAA